MADPDLPPRYPRMERPAHRPKPMRVLGLGMSRTGTMSLYVALKKLGYTCYHMAECGRDAANDSLTLWHAAIDAKYYGKGQKFEGEDFDKMLWRYDAVTDVPCILFVDELLAAYPDAQIVLTNRPVETWVPSIKRTFYTILSWKRWAFIQLFDDRMAHYIPILRTGPDIWTGGNWQDTSRLPEGYAKHYDHVRAVAKAQGREVLEFKVQDGWKPLCEFLGKEVPDGPFPRVNEGDFAVKMQYTIFWMRTLVVVVRGLKLAAPVAAAAGVWRYFRGK